MAIEVFTVTYAKVEKIQRMERNRVQEVRSGRR